MNGKKAKMDNRYKPQNTDSNRQQDRRKPGEKGQKRDVVKAGHDTALQSRGNKFSKESKGNKTTQSNEARNGKKIEYGKVNKRGNKPAGTDINIYKDNYFEDLDYRVLTPKEKERYSKTNIRGSHQEYKGASRNIQQKQNLGKQGQERWKLNQEGQSQGRLSQERLKQEWKEQGKLNQEGQSQGRQNQERLSQRKDNKKYSSGEINDSLYQDKRYSKKNMDEKVASSQFQNKTTYNSNSNPLAARSVKKGGCPYIKRCGGCNILQQSYEKELQEKQKTVENLIGKYCKVESIIGMKEPKYYRNKVHVVFDHDKKGNPVSGVYEVGTHHVIPVSTCLIHNKKADEIIATIRNLLKSFKIRTYDEDTGYGLLRHVLIRTGYASKEIMVVLVLASQIMPSKNNFIKALREKHPEITTIIINVNDKKTSMVLGDKEHVIYGKGYIEDSLCGKVFCISPRSFFQVNPAQTEYLYGQAVDMAGLSGKETIIDAYCGTGTIGMIASDHAKRVIGVEQNQDAVSDAKVNARRNYIRNIEFYNNDAGLFMSQMATQKESADVIFMDPPRTGSTEQFLDAIAVLKPKKVVYISCNPVTLERDLAYLTKKGYRAERAVPVDMFPWTRHVETVVLMSRVAK